MKKSKEDLRVIRSRRLLCQALFTLIEEKQKELFLSAIKKRSFSSINEIFVALIEMIVEYLDAYREKILKILENNGVDKIAGLLVGCLKKNITYLLSENHFPEKENMPNDLIIDLFTGGVTNIGLSYVRSAYDYSKDELLKYFTAVATACRN